MNFCHARIYIYTYTCIYTITHTYVYSLYVHNIYIDHMPNKLYIYVYYMYMPLVDIWWYVYVLIVCGFHVIPHVCFMILHDFWWNVCYNFLLFTGEVLRSLHFRHWVSLVAVSWPPIPHTGRGADQLLPPCHSIIRQMRSEHVELHLWTVHLASNSDNSARGSTSSIFDTTSWSWNELEGSKRDRAPNVAGHARGEISNTPSNTSAIPMCSKSKPRPQIDPFLFFFLFLSPVLFPNKGHCFLFKSSFFSFVFFLFLFPLFVHFSFIFLSACFPISLLFLSPLFPYFFPFLFVSLHKFDPPPS